LVAKGECLTVVGLLMVAPNVVMRELPASQTRTAMNSQKSRRMLQ